MAREHDSESSGAESAAFGGTPTLRDGHVVTTPASALDGRTSERFFELSQDLFAAVDLSGVVRYANPAWRQVLGYEPAEVVGMHLRELLLREDWQATERAARRAIAHGSLFGFENRFRCRDGSTRWLQWNIEVDAEAAVAYGIGRDTTARRTAEAALAESEATYRALFESSLEGVLVVTEDGRAVAANDAMRAMLGRASDDATPLHRDAVFDRSDPRFDEALAQRSSSGRFFGELTLVRADGSRFPAEVSATLFEDAAGERRISAVVRDVSDRRALENALRRSAEQVTLQATAMKAASNAIVITDRHGTIEWANPAFTSLTGYELDEAVGRKTSLVRSGEHSDAFYQELWATIQAGRAWEGEMVNRRKDGSLYPEAQTITPVLDGDGSIAHFIAIKHDLSERKPAERALLDSEASFRQLLHDNPLPMYVYDRETHAFLAVNEAMVRHYGYSEAEFLAMTIRDIRPEEEVGKLVEHLRRTRPGLVKEGVWRHRLKDGTPADVDITSHVLTFQGHDARLAVAQDVTDRLKAERELQASEERYRMLADNAVDVVFRLRVRPDFAFEYVSPSAEALTGYTPEEHYENPRILDAVLPADDLEALISTALRGDPYLSTVRYFRKDGSLVYMEQHNRPVLGPDGRVEAVEGIMRDVTPRVLAEQRAASLNARLEAHLDRFKAIHRIDTTILVDGPLRNVLRTTLQQIAGRLRVDAATVYRTDVARGRLYPLATRGMPKRAVTLTLGQGIAGEVAQTSVPVKIRDAREEGGHDTTFLQEFEFRGCLALPLVSMGKLEGVLEFFTYEPLDLDEDAQVFAEAVSQQIALAIQRDTLVTGLQQARDELEDAYDRTIEGWALALDLKDEETAGHSQRVTDLTLQLSERLAVPQEELQHVRRGALLHDIGKMGIPDAILLKPGRLTHAEFEVVKRHPAYAFDMLKDIPFLRPAMAIPRSHHERWDGTGYPEGLAGEAIPLAARIFAVVDVYDALTSDRPYRKAWSRAKALEHIREGSGSHFDPAVVDVFMGLAGESRD